MYICLLRTLQEMVMKYASENSQTQQTKWQSEVKFSNLCRYKPEKICGYFVVMTLYNVHKNITAILKSKLMYFMTQFRLYKKKTNSAIDLYAHYCSCHLYY